MFNEIIFAPSILAGKAYCVFKGVKFGKNLRAFGVPLIHRHPGAVISIGDNVVLTSTSRVNLSGVRGQVILAAPCANSRIVIGNNSGLSGAVIYAASSVTIGNNVNIGANARIYDSDMHPIGIMDRRLDKRDKVVSNPVVVEDDVWVGACAIILKGVTIGRGAIVGAGSVVTKNVPPCTIWAGNPAKQIRELRDEKNTICP